VLKGFRYEQRLNTGSDEDYVLVFAKGGERRMAAWTTSATKHNTTFAASSDTFTITKRAGGAGGQVTARDGKIAVELSAAPIYLVPVK